MTLKDWFRIDGFGYIPEMICKPSLVNDIMGTNLKYARWQEYMDWNDPTDLKWFDKDLMSNYKIGLEVPIQSYISQMSET